MSEVGLGSKSSTPSGFGIGKQEYVLQDSVAMDKFVFRICRAELPRFDEYLSPRINLHKYLAMIFQTTRSTPRKRHGCSHEDVNWFLMYTNSCL